VGVIEQKVDPAGNVYALLYSPPGGVEVKKFDTSGRLLWTSSAPDGSAKLDFDAAGDAYVIGQPDVMTWPDTHDVVTMKYDPSGRPLWKARFRTDAGWHNGGSAPVLAVDRATGIVYVTISMEKGFAEEGALVTIKYAADGHEEWVRRYRPGAASVGGLSDDPLAVAPDGGAVVLAGTDLPDADVLLRYDAQGSLLWMYREPDGTMGLLTVGPDGAVYVGSWSGVSKYAPTGQLLWTAPCRVSRLQVDGAGGVYVTEDTWAPGLITRKYGPSGEQLWSAQYVAPDGVKARPSALTLDASASAYVTILLEEEAVDPNMPYLPGGWLYREVALVTVKYDANGTQQWLAIHDPPPQYGPPIEDVAVDAQGRVYVLAGGIVIKYAQVEYGQPGG